MTARRSKKGPPVAPAPTVGPGKKGLLPTRRGGVVVAFPRDRATRAWVNKAFFVLVVSRRGLPVETSNNAARFEIDGVDRGGKVALGLDRPSWSGN